MEDIAIWSMGDLQSFQISGCMSQVKHIKGIISCYFHPFFFSKIEVSNTSKPKGHILGWLTPSSGYGQMP